MKRLFCSFIFISSIVHPSYSSIIDVSSRVVLGDVWRLDQYCNDDRDAKQLLEDDQLSQSLFNGSMLMGTSNFRINEINRLLINTVRARTSISNCYVKTWGYASETDYNLSNQPFDNETDCLLGIDRLYNYMISLDSYQRQIGQNDGSYKETDLYVQLASFGRATLGPIHQNQLWIGDYDKCMSLPWTRHCIGSYETLSNDNIRYPFDLRGLRVSLCLPRSCTSQIAKFKPYLGKIDALVNYNMLNGFGLSNNSNHQLIDIHCPPADDSYYMNPFLKISSTLLMIVGFLWVSMVLYSTIIDNTSDHIKSEFNLRVNWKRLTKKRIESYESRYLDIMKVTGMIWLIINHLFIVVLNIAKDFTEAREKLLAVVIFQAQYVVTLFFLIGAYLSTKPLFNNSKKSNQLKLIIQRYSRLAPMYVVVHIFIQKFAYLLNSGPFWDYAVSPQSEARQCSLESPLVPILMISNFVNPTAHCVLTGWYISNDFQIFILTTFLFRSYQHSRSRGRLMLSIGFLVSHLQRVWNFSVASNFSIEQFYKDSLIFGATVVGIRMAPDYLNPIGRIGAYFAGVLLADFATSNRSYNRKYEVDASSEEQSKLASSFDRIKLLCYRFLRFNSRQLLFMAVFALGTVFSAVLISDDIKFSFFGKFNKSLAYPYMILINEIGWFLLVLSVIVRALEKSQLDTQKVTNSTTAKTTESSLWTTLSKLNYCVMLTHFTILKYIYQSSRNLISFNYCELLQMTLLGVTSSYLIALVLHLLVEAPLQAMVQRFTKYITAEYFETKEQMTDVSIHGNAEELSDRVQNADNSRKPCLSH